MTDVRGLSVGHWTDRKAATGCTVVLCDGEGAVAGVDVRGSAPGTRETDLLHPVNLVERVHAVLIGGGSALAVAQHDRAAGGGLTVGPVTDAEAADVCQRSAVSYTHLTLPTNREV